MRPALALLAVLPLLAAAGPVPVPPRPARYVTDGAGVLGADVAEALDARLADFERRTSSQVLVWIAPRVPEGTTAEELGAEAIRAWGVGQKGKDNGVVFFLFTEQRRTRIATGYGLEGALPDARAKQILAEVVRPHVAEGDFSAAVELGVDAILSAVASEQLTGTGQTVAEREGGPPWMGWAAWAFMLAVFALAVWRRSLAILGVGAAVGVAGVFGYLGDLPPAAGMPAAVLALMMPLAVFGSIVRALQRRGIPLTFASRGRTAFRERDEEWSGPDGGSSSGSASSSAFEGGGGDSGGGGASDDAGGGSKD